MTRICFLDCETTSLRPDRRAWEVALIVRDPLAGEYGTQREHHWFIRAEDLDLGNADPFALKVGRFYERHPQYGLSRETSRTSSVAEAEVLRQVESLTRGATLVGAVPSFDTETLGPRMRAHGILPSWDYRLRDIGSMAAGWLACAVAEGTHDSAPPLGAGTDDYALKLGIDLSQFERHTALGDCRLAAALFDVMGGAG